jgi:hypothetical protein
MKLKKKDKKGFNLKKKNWKMKLKIKKWWTQRVNLEIFQPDSLPITSLE